jgi:hypothetical protein
VALSAFLFLITRKEQHHYRTLRNHCTLPVCAVCACFYLRSVAPYPQTPARRDLDSWHSFSGGHTNFKSNLQPCALGLDFVKLLSSLAIHIAFSSRLAFVGSLTVLPSSRPGHLSSFNLSQPPLPPQFINGKNRGPSPPSSILLGLHRAVPVSQATSSLSDSSGISARPSISASLLISVQSPQVHLTACQHLGLHCQHPAVPD